MSMEREAIMELIVCCTKLKLQYRIVCSAANLVRYIETLSASSESAVAPKRSKSILGLFHSSNIKEYDQMIHLIEEKFIILNGLYS